MNHFPAEINAWKNDVARRLVRLRGEVDGIMINLPMIPDPEIGIPFTGPLSPVPFGWPQGEVGTGGTPSTVANHCVTCPTALRYYEISVSGITNRGTCVLCNNANGIFTLEAVDGLGGSGTQATSFGTITCAWVSTTKFKICTTASLNEYRWVLRVVSATESRLFLEDFPGGAVRAEYLYVGCPPAAGSGSGTVVFNRISNFLNDCQTYPLTIPLRGVS